MSEKKKITQKAKIIPLRPKMENHQLSTTSPVSSDLKSSKVFFNVLLQIDQMLESHFQGSTKENAGKQNDFPAI